MKYATSEGAKPGTTVLKLEGPFTLGNMFKLQAELRGLKPDCLIIDMESVPYMDSAGLGVIMNYFVSAQSAGRKFFLAGVNERVRSLLEMTKVDTILKMYDTVETAQALA
ncbi:MAG: STAS domain-containing protein [Acidobacteriota bacterium]|nr:STAS domain-containing protein [Acidobacteriota bacterium]